MTWNRWFSARGDGRECSGDSSQGGFVRHQLHMCSWWRTKRRWRGRVVSLAAPAGLLLALLAIPIVALHMLRPRRPPLEVSSTLLWQEVSRPATAARPWQRLRPSVLLFLQLLVVALLALAAARPVRVSSTPLARHTVFILDASGSMAATDGSPDRMASARAAARRLREKLPSGGVASLVVASAQPRVLLSASPDSGAF